MSAESPVMRAGMHMSGIVSNESPDENVVEGQNSEMMMLMPFGRMARPFRQPFCSICAFEARVDWAHIAGDRFVRIERYALDE